MAKMVYLRKNYKIWFFAFVFLNSVILFLSIMANPYRLTPVQITIKGINDIKPRLYDYQRYVKLFDIAYIKPKTILLGSSRVLWGIDPSNPLLNEYPPVYNLGIIGPPIYEVKYYFEHALANQPHLKRVVLALDFYSFNSKFDNRDFELKKLFGKNWKEILIARKDLFFDVRATIETIGNSLIRKKVMSLREDGRLTPDPLSDKKLYSNFFNPEPSPSPPAQSSTQQAQLSGPPQIKASRPLQVQPSRLPLQPSQHQVQNELPPQPTKSTGMRSELYYPFKMSKQSFEALRFIIDTCRKHNIELIIYISPLLSGGEVNIFHEFGIWNDYENYQRSLAKLHPFWDFTSWNSITMNKDNFIDGSHHIFPVGDMILARMFGKADKNVPASFGRLVTEKNIEQHIKDLNHEYKLNLRS